MEKDFKQSTSPSVVESLPSAKISHSSMLPKLLFLLILVVIVAVVSAGINLLPTRYKQIPAQSSSPKSIGKDVATNSASTPSQTQNFDDTLRIDLIDSLYVDLQRYYADNLIYPEALDKLIPKYVTNVATDPVTWQPFLYTPSKDLKSFTLQATLSTGETYSGDSQNQQKIMNTVIKAEIYQIQSVLESYRNATTVYPSSLSVVVPAYLKVIFKNPYSLKTYSYKMANDNYILTTELPDGTTISLKSVRH